MSLTPVCRKVPLVCFHIYFSWSLDRTYQLKVPSHIAFIFFPYPYVFPVTEDFNLHTQFKFKLTIIYRASFGLLSPQYIILEIGCFAWIEIDRKLRLSMQAFELNFENSPVSQQIVNNAYGLKKMNFNNVWIKKCQEMSFCFWNSFAFSV